MLLLAAALVSFPFVSGMARVPPPPNPRHLEEVTYDKANNKLLVFGGIELIKNGWIEPSAVHEWDGDNWQVKASKGPCGRRGHVWIYDESINETVLIGGVAKGKALPDSAIFDIWNWDGNTWRSLNGSCPVKEPEGVYDPVNKRILVYGDAGNKHTINYDIPAAFELWEYKNSTWNKLSSNGPDITGSRMMAFDIVRNKLVMPVFEANTLIVWEWSDIEWKKIVVDKDHPAYRNRSALAYDPFEQVIVLFGGLSADDKQFGDFWKWDGVRWREMESAKNPPARNSAHFACSDVEVFLYGGSVPKAAPAQGIELSNELWSWRDSVWKKLH